MVSPKKTDGTAILTKEVRELRQAVDASYKAFRLANQLRRALAMSFLKGVVSALGAFAAVVIVTPVFIWVLQNISWPPIIADIVTHVIHQYEQVNRQSLQVVDGQ